MKFESLDDSPTRGWSYFGSIDATFEFDPNWFTYLAYGSQMRLKFTIQNVTATKKESYGVLFRLDVNASKRQNYRTDFNTYNYNIDGNISAIYVCTSDVFGWIPETETEKFQSFQPEWSKRIQVYGNVQWHHQSKLAQSFN